MEFTKMHGAGNDYIYVNCFKWQVPDPAALAVKVSDRRFGLGSDGLVLICPSDVADLRMDIYNMDGSRAKMCGNASRCVGKYAYERGMTGGKTAFTLETLSGIKRVWVEDTGGRVERVRVDMGAPILAGRDIPTVFDEEKILQKPVQIDGREYEITCVSMGNPHCVVFDPDPAALDLARIGPTFEKNPIFPEGVNTEFIKVQDMHTIIMRVWERGSGETLACGTGACAAAVACVLTGQTERRVNVHLRGGTLEIEWAQDGRVYMAGPAAEVFTTNLDYGQVLSWKTQEGF